MDGTAAVVAVAGLITTASSPVILTWRNARNQERANLRDLRIALCTDATFYAENLHSTVDRLTDQLHIWKKHTTSSPLDAEAITARMRLLASKEVTEAWQRLLFNELRLRWDIQQDYPDVGAEGGRLTIPSDLDSAIDTEASIQEFYAIVGKTFVNG